MKSLERALAAAVLFALASVVHGQPGIREVTIGTSDAQNGPVPMMRMQAAAAGSTSGDALSIEPGKALVTATVNGTVQMK